MSNNNNSTSVSFAIVVDNDVAAVLNFPKDVVGSELIIAALSSNPRVVRRPEIVTIESKGPMAFFDLYIDDELGLNIGYRTDQDSAGAIIAGLSSNPTIILIDSSLGVSSGWTWDGTDFTAPQ